LRNGSGDLCNKDKGRGDGSGALERLAKRAHGFIPEVKEDNVIRLGCEDVNSLSIFHPTKTKMRKLTNLHQRYQTDGACTLEHGINFKMAASGTRPEYLFLGVCSSRVSTGHNKHELHSRYHQGRTMTVAFYRLASYVNAMWNFTSLGLPFSKYSVILA
jgi:hypothetical protein